MKKSFTAFVKKVVSSTTFKTFIQDSIIYLLKLQAFGGIRGWIIKKMVGEFAEEVIDVITHTVDYVEIKHIVKDTVNEEDRDLATDQLNDIMH